MIRWPIAGSMQYFLRLRRYFVAKIEAEVTGIAGIRTNVEENEALKNKFNKKVRNGKKAAASTGLKKSSNAETEEASGKHIESRKDEQLTSRIKTDNNEGGIAKIILQSIPPESCITSVKFEGPNIALYTKNPKFSLTELTYHLSSLSKILKKRFEIGRASCREIV